MGIINGKWREACNAFIFYTSPSLTLQKNHSISPLVSYYAICVEFTNIMLSCFQKVSKEYSFEKLDVPAESEYLEVRYSVSAYTLRGNNCKMHLLVKIYHPVQTKSSYYCSAKATPN